MKNTVLFIALFLIITVSCQQPVTSDPDLIMLNEYMTGSFASTDQAEADTNFLDIRLEMVRIWPERTDGFWLYVEQAAAWSLDKPYRQRIYRLTKNEDDTFESAVFMINNPLRFAGDFRKENPLQPLSVDSLVIRNGCSIILRKTGDNTFAGGTLGQNCQSNLRGAAFSTSETVITPDQLSSLDRGWNAAGEQVWGSEFGPYIFKKVRNY